MGVHLPLDDQMGNRDERYGSHNPEENYTLKQKLMEKYLQPAGRLKGWIQRNI